MLTTNNKEIQLGDIKFGVPYEFSYRLYNISKNPAIINSIVEGCKSCTKSSLTKDIIPSGDYAELKVVFTPGNLGKTLKGISVVYNSGIELKLTFRANVYG
jgi:hypothetical protein